MTVQLHIALFIVLIILAVWGSLHLLWCLVVYVLYPLCEMIGNYKKYKTYYDEHFEDRFQEFLNKKEEIANLEKTAKEIVEKHLDDEVKNE